MLFKSIDNELVANFAANGILEVTLNILIQLEVLSFDGKLTAVE